MKLHILVFALFSTAPLVAQKCSYVPDNLLTGGSNVIPFGRQSPTNSTWRNQRYQTLVPVALLGNTPGRICELAFVPATSGLRQFSSIKVQLAQTTATALSTSFATNLQTNTTTVLESKNYFWPNVANTWNRIGCQNSFLYIPQRGNLVIDIEVRGAGMPASNPAHAGFRSVSQVRLYAFSWTTNPPANGTLSTSAGLRMELCFDTNDAGAFGRGCAGSNQQVPQLSYGGSAKLGSTLSIDMGSGLASRPVVLLAALSNTAPFPVDLTGAGAPGCTLYIPPQFVSATVTNTSGAISIKLPIPNDSALVCGRFYNQFFPIDAQANQLGVSASNYGRVLLGN